MRCLECGAQSDELNESQPICPICETPSGTGRDDDHVAGAGALFDDAPPITSGEYPDPAFDSNETVRMPLDLQEALEDAESLLLAVGHVAFDRPEGFRIFPLLTEKIM